MTKVSAARDCSHATALTRLPDARLPTRDYLEAEDSAQKKSPPKEIFSSEALAFDHKINLGASSRRRRSVARGYW
jgi:hypothetical protein